MLGQGCVSVKCLRMKTDEEASEGGKEAAGPLWPNILLQNRAPALF